MMLNLYIIANIDYQIIFPSHNDYLATVVLTKLNNVRKRLKAVFSFINKQKMVAFNIINSILGVMRYKIYITKLTATTFLNILTS